MRKSDGSLRGGRALACGGIVLAFLAVAAPAQASRDAYVANSSGNDVRVIDTGTNGFVGSPIPVGSAPLAVAIKPGADRAYVANSGTDNLSRIDTTTKAVDDTFATGSVPFAVAITPDGSRLYVANQFSDTVTVFNTADDNQAPGSPISLGGFCCPSGIAITPDGTRVYVTNQGNDAVSVVDTSTNTITTTITSVGSAPTGIAITPDGSRIYVANESDGTVAVIDTSSNTLLTSIPVGDQPLSIAIGPDGLRAYVTNSLDASVSVINTATNTVVGLIPVGAFPYGIAVRPDGARAYVANKDDSSVSVIDTATNMVLTTITGVGDDPTGIAILPNQGPSAAFSATGASSGQPASFNGSGSSDPDGTVADHAWDFGDGSPVVHTASPTTSHTYSTGGHYNATLTVTDNEGCANSFIYTGQTASCTGSAVARIQHPVAITAATGMSTTPSGVVTVGGQVHDTATLSNGVSATGTITFRLYGPNDFTCSGSPAFTDTASVNGNGSYTSGDFTTLHAGSYRWSANYSGDANNDPSASTCNESVLVGLASPSLTTSASSDVVLGGAVHDTATLSGGHSPTGTVTFRLFPPSDPSCELSPIFTSTVSVSGNGDYPSADYTPSAIGTYRWTAAYSGDPDNNIANGTCNAPGESVAVTLTSPSLTTSASSDVLVGGAVHDTATLAGGSSPTGSIAFRLFGPDDTTCSGPPVLTDTVTVSAGNGSYPSASFTPTTSGTYRWTAAYSGDTNNNPASTACNDPNESVSVTVPSPPTPNPEPPSPSPGPPPGPAPLVPPAPGPEPPSNTFAFPKVKAKGNVLVFVFDFPGAGVLRSLLTTHKLPASAAVLRPGPNRTAVAVKAVTRDAAGRVTVRLPLNKRGRHIHKVRGKLPVRLTLVYTPTGGDPNRTARKLTIPRR